MAALLDLLRVSLATSCLAACYGSGPASDDAFAAEWDVLPRIAEAAYRGDGFVHVTPAPYPSAIAPDKHIDVWVSVDGWSQFVGVSPDVAGSGAEVPRGTVIVREVIVGGAIESLTVMARGAAGYSPDHGDWWYGVLDEYGWPMLVDGVPVMGTLEERCAGCHADRADDGFVFGVPAARRDPALLP